MTIFSILAALLLQQFRPRPNAPSWGMLVERFAAFLERYFNAGDHRYGVLAWGITMLAILAACSGITYLLGSISAIFVWLLNAAVLYFTLGFRGPLWCLGHIQHALRTDDLERARSLLGQLMGRPAPAGDRTQITRLAIEQGILQGHRELFGVLFWFIILPGPAGALIYPAAWVLARAWSTGTAPDEREFGWFATQALEWLDWIPQRLTALSFAIVGNFEDALYCWRSQAEAWGHPMEGILLASGAGALGVRLGEPLSEPSGIRLRTELGAGENPDADYLQSVEGMLWRCLVLWLSVITLVTLAGWVGG